MAASSLAMLRRLAPPAMDGWAAGAGCAGWRRHLGARRPAARSCCGMSTVALETLGQSLPEKAQYDAGQAFIHAKFGTLSRLVDLSPRGRLTSTRGLSGLTT